MDNREEILKKHCKDFAKTDGNYDEQEFDLCWEELRKEKNMYSLTLEAMQQYATQEAVGFSEWLNVNCEIGLGDGENDYWIYYQRDRDNKSKIVGVEYTTEQLYSIYKSISKIK